MKLAILKETQANEARVAIVPEVAGKLIGLGHTIALQAGAGLAAGYTDAAYAALGAQIAPDVQGALQDADILLKVRGPSLDEIKALPEGLTLIGQLEPYNIDAPMLAALNARKITSLAMEFTPRISRAQAMDALSSQSNLAGYRAVIEAANLYGRAMPMMMTAAGTIPAARVFIMGAGVAGLQAIATARRLGAVVTATDVRPAAKEQVASLGAKFIAVENEEFKAAETAGGYAKAMSAEYQAKQAALVAAHIAKQDIVITTALIPGRAAPVLVTQDMVAAMRPGSVILDMAVAQGGNCPISKPDQVVEHNGVKVAGYTNLPSHLPGDASALYARNLMAFLPLITAKDGSLNLDTEDEIVTAMLLTRGGVTIHERLKA